MKRRALLLGLAASGCGPRGSFTFLPATEASRETRPVFLATNREGPLGVARIDVSYPTNGATGVVDYDGRGRFAVASSTSLDRDAFLSEMTTTGPADARVGLFVHGYNNTAAEAVYRHAQIARDFGEPGPQVTFAWPSVANALGYVADRDAALRSRGALEDLLLILARGQPRKITLIGHSMGGFLVMETLRQMALSGVELADRLEGVVLVSPDIDIDLFREQAAVIGDLPKPFIVTISRRDRILGISARLAGRRARLGSPDDLTRLRDLDLIVIDLSSSRGGSAGGHLQAATSPDAVNWLNAIERFGDTFDERRGLELIVPG